MCVMRVIPRLFFRFSIIVILLITYQGTNLSIVKLLASTPEEEKKVGKGEEEEGQRKGKKKKRKLKKERLSLEEILGDEKFLRLIARQVVSSEQSYQIILDKINLYHSYKAKDVWATHSWFDEEDKRNLPEPYQSLARPDKRTFLKKKESSFLNEQTIRDLLQLVQITIDMGKVVVQSHTAAKAGTVIVISHNFPNKILGEIGEKELKKPMNPKFKEASVLIIVIDPLDIFDQVQRNNKKALDADMKGKIVSVSLS